MGSTKIVGMVFTFERSRQGYQSEGQPGSTPSRSVEPRTPAKRYLCDKKGVWVAPVAPIGYFYLFSIYFGVDRTWPPLTGLLFIAFLRRSVKDG